jgi:GNAT superfamily N-acetyltransferase
MRVNLNHPASSALVCRPARATDTPAVLEICSHIWEGEDYIPEVWEDWLADPLGLLAVAEWEGRVVGLGKLTRILPGSWWLEGLRIHPDFAGRGFASRLYGYLHDHWLSHGDGVIRLTTYSENAPVHRMCARMGYAKIAEFTPYQAPPAAGLQPSPFSRLTEAQLPTALATARSSESMALCRGLIDLDWTWGDLNPGHLLETAQQGLLWSWRGGEGILAARVNTHPGQSEALYAGIIACSLSNLGQLLLDFRRLAGALGYPGAGWCSPLNPEVIAALSQAGYTRYWDEGSLYLYEYCHPAGLAHGE